VLTIRYFAVGDFEVDPGGGTIVVRPALGPRASLVPVLLASNVPGIVLGLRNVPVLHASAVEIGGAGVAFVGGLGAGKTTLAALMCSEGAALITDDAARLETRDDLVAVHRGTGELRLRAPAAVLAERVGGATRTTVDERIAVAARPIETPTAPLGAVVFPRWSPGAPGPVIRPMRKREALEALIRYPLVTGWRTPEPARVHFEASAALASRVPAFAAELPQGALEDESFGPALRERLVAARAIE